MWGGMLAAHSVHALEVAGVRLDDTTIVEGSSLVLNGAGVRSRVFVKVYVAGLYLPQKTQQVQIIVNVTGPRRIVMRMMRGLDAQTLTDGLEDGVRSNNPPAEQVLLKAPMEDLVTQMGKIGRLNESDTVIIDMSPQMTRVLLNGRPAAQVKSAALPSALLRIWLGENPVDGALKTALLGG